MRPKRLKDGSTLQEKEDYDGSEKEAHDDVLLIEQSQKTQKTGALATLATANMKNTLMCSASTVVEKAL